MITKKFDYHNISRININGKRHYKQPDGVAVPSVTTVLDRTKSAAKKRALEDWRNSVGHDRAAQIVQEAADRGTRMHKYLEDYVEKDSLPNRGSNPFGWPSYAMAETIVEQGLVNADEYWGSEVPLYFPGVYAGTTDCVGVYKGKPAIIDFKQSNKVKKEEWIEDYKLQLCAYAEAHNELFGTDIQQGVILMAVKPKTDKQGNIIEPPQFLEFSIAGNDFDYWRAQWWNRLEQYYCNC